ncbi:YybH family protein [Gemmatimonas sp.]|uniref:YybH family protein n=1 Tax=Gemmatimonas sp. TaxID=1962908 RepID=UPI003983CAED
MRPPVRRLFAVGVVAVSTMSMMTACTDPLRVSPADRRAIADTLSALVTSAYDFSKPAPAARLLSLYPDSGRIISAVAGRVTTTREPLAGEIAGFWQRVGRNMQQPRFVLGSTYVDVITRDAAVLTLVYSIPHITPQGSPHTVSGAWTMLWRRENGRWRIVQEHLSDTPESTAPGLASEVPIASPPPSHQH